MIMRKIFGALRGLTVAMILTLAMAVSAPAQEALSNLGITASASSELNGTRTAQMAVDGSGLNGYNHNDVSDGFMWHSAAYGANPQTQWIKFDLGGTYTMDSMLVWNHNEGGAAWQGTFGIKDAEIYSSATGTGNPVDNTGEWTLVKTVTLTRALGEGGVRGAAYVSPDTIDLPGVSTRYLSIRALNSYSDDAGEPAPGTLGLSEVVFFKNATMIPDADITASASSELIPTRPASNTVDGSGFELTTVSELADPNMWHSAHYDALGGVATQWIKFDLGSSRALDSMLVWNHNEGGVAWQGIFGMKDCNIFQSATGTGNPVDNSGEWTLVKQVTLTRALGHPSQGYPYNSPDSIGLPGVTTQYIAIQALSSYAVDFPDDTVGLSEVQFYTSAVSVPQVTANAALEITNTGAQFNGELVADGGSETQVTIYWGSVDKGKTATGWDHTESLGVTAVGPITLTRDTMSLLTAYTYRIYAENATGGAWSEPVTFETTPVEISLFEIE